MTALVSGGGHVAPPAFLEEVQRWAAVAATCGVICAMILGLFYLVNHAGAAIER